MVKRSTATFILYAWRKNDINEKLLKINALGKLAGNFKLMPGSFQTVGNAGFCVMIEGNTPSAERAKLICAITPMWA
jgi:hypothetical protein